MRFAMMTYVVVFAACSSTNVSQTPASQTASRPSELELIVANQQSASASVLKADGVTMMHIPVGNGPHEAMISPDGKIGVVSIYGAQQPGNQIAVIDMARDSVIRTIDLGQYRRPHGMGFFEGSRMLIATSEASQNVVIVDLQTGAIEAIP
ncbi:MAG TPA: hypothetical protein VM100_13510, partial [Longimicrobiales bacterium]|nr:hypothetical protein [Longimicrobiales bacterium]